MKEISKKIILYSSSAGALLAVSANALAHTIPGKITGGDGNTILNHHDDVVFIDINNDGINEFVGYMYASTDSSDGGDIYSYKAVLFGDYGSGPSGYAEMEQITLPPLLHKFDVNDPIGPFNYPSDFGILSIYTSEPLQPNSPMNDPISIDNTFLLNGTGYVGVALGELGEVHYGWIQVDMNEGDANFINCAIESNKNTPITAGSTVPLLPIASALGLGLVGTIAALRKRNRKQ